MKKQHDDELDQQIDAWLGQQPIELKADFTEKTLQHIREEQPQQSTGKLISFPAQLTAVAAAIILLLTFLSLGPSQTTDSEAEGNTAIATVAAVDTATSTELSDPYLDVEELLALAEPLAVISGTDEIDLSGELLDQLFVAEIL